MRLHVKGMPPTSVCAVHLWPTGGLGQRLIAAMREAHGNGGITVCVECIERAKEDAGRKAAPR
jgi:hypothetical protein